MTSRIIYLSGPQWRVMDKLLASKGTARFTGSARATIKKLEELKLVYYMFDVVADASRGRHQLRYVVTLTDSGRRLYEDAPQALATVNKTIISNAE